MNEGHHLSLSSVEAEEDEIKNFISSIQEEIYHKPKQNMLVIIGD